MDILKQAESGVPVSEPCREHGMSDASFYKCRAKFGGMDASMISELKAIAEELVLSRLRSGLSTHLSDLSFECQGAFSA